VRECLRTGHYTHEQIRDLTLREVSEVLSASAWRRSQEERAAKFGAWHVGLFVALAKHGKLEELDHYLGDEGGGEPIELTPQQEYLAFRLLSIQPAEKPAVH